MGIRIAPSVVVLWLWVVLPGQAAAGGLVLAEREAAAGESNRPGADGADPAWESAGVVLPASEPPIVGSVELHLSKGADASGLEPLITLRPGSPLLKREVRRTLERLYGTGRFVDISVTATKEGDGRLSLVIEADTRTFVGRVDFEGNKVLPETALRKALALTDGQPEYYPEFVDRLAGRLREVYRRIGYTRARIGHQLLRGELGETVLSFQIREGAPSRLEAVHVAGDPQLPVEEMLRTLGMKPGDVLDLDRLDSGFAALKARYRAEAHYRARFGTPQISEEGGRATLRLPITAGPAVELRFKGNDALDEAELLAVLAYDPEETLDEALLAGLQDRLTSYYRLSGFADAKVVAREVRASDRRRSFLVFYISEGAPLRVVAVAFEGNSHFASRFLQERLDESLLEAAGEGTQERGKPNEVFAGGPPGTRARFHTLPKSVWYEPAYRQALDRIVDLYRADGYLSAHADPPLIERDEMRREARVQLRVHEGPQTIVSDVAVLGAPAGDKLRATAVSVKRGRPLNSLEVETSRQAIQRALGREGHVFAKVEDEERFSADRTEAKVSFRVWAGPRVRVGRIVVQGLNRTHESVVRGALALEEGGLLDAEQMAQSQRNLMRVGIFRTVALRMNTPELPEEVKDVFVTVEERSTQSVTLSGGYSFADGPRLALEYTKSNLAGRALQGSARFKFNYVNLNVPKLALGKPLEDGFNALGRHLNLSLQYPRVLALLPIEAGVRVDLVHEFLNRPSYNFERTAAILGADLAGPHGVSATIAYEIEYDEVLKKSEASTVGLSRSDIERLRFAPGQIYLHSLRPSVSIDWRDDPANPHRGAHLSATTEFVQSLGGALEAEGGGTREPSSLFIKATAQASGYIPLPRRAVLALSLKGGKVFPLALTSETIMPKRFFLGGANSMRGFFDDGMVAEDQRQGLREKVAQCDAILNKTGCDPKAELVRRGETLLSEGGELFLLGRAEVRFPVYSSLEGAVFFDAGNLWLDQSQFDPLRLRYATGVGLRLVTPIGPLALDGGINLAPDRTLNEAVGVLHFSIGLF
ncbi:MAG: BamA/TamA family outer membrane protein [Deltaproteobacteria bacterium]|nr:BamA/TamA family outer membrane protein [Deltaproteobacteria bacterium]